MKISHIIIVFILMSSCTTNNDWTITESKIDEGLHDIEAMDDDVAFAYSYGTGHLYKTTDAGADWEIIFHFNSLYFEQISSWMIKPDGLQEVQTNYSRQKMVESIGWINQ